MIGMTKVVPDGYHKKKIPKAVREQVWLQKAGKCFETKCKTSWCQNKITVFDFQCGHDIPESKGGSTTVANLWPICSRCNLSMGNTYTFQQWNKMSAMKPLTKTQPKRTWYLFFKSCVQVTSAKSPQAPSS